MKRFWDKVKKGPKCWLWTGATVSKGYGSISIKKKFFGAHRLSWIMERGSIPEGLHVLHRCDVRACVRPSHLFLGTNSDNVADRVAKGREGDRSGEKNGAAKLTAKEVLKIRRLYSDKKNAVSYTYLAAVFGVSKPQIARIVNRSSWV